MADFTDKNILICCNLKKERVSLFNYFDSNDAEMIHSAKDIKGCVDILNSENIDYLVVEYCPELLKSATELKDLIHGNAKLDVILVVNSNTKMSSSEFYQFQENSKVILFSPLSDLEIAIKLPELFTLVTHPEEKAKSEIKIDAKTDDSELTQELWNVFFNDSASAKIIVNAENQEIIQINDSLANLLQLKKSEILHQNWNFFDDESNHKNYAGYIKEINSQDKTNFIIKYAFKNEIYYFNANYQMGVLDGNIVFIGEIRFENTQGISEELFQYLKKINQITLQSEQFPILLNVLREFLRLDFLLFFEYSDSKLSKPVVTGDGITVKKFLEKSLGDLLPLIQANHTIKLDREKHKVNEYSHLLDDNNLQTFMNFPVFYKDKTYGAMVAGGSSLVDDWQTTTTVFDALIKQCQFELFQKNIVEQREFEGLIDKLTGLPNRNSMTKKLAKLIEAGIDADNYISLMIIDVDKINYFNKSLGIELTNQIIVAIAQIMTHCISNKGQVYRLSGDEFMILLKPHREKKLVEYVAFELIEMLNKPILLSNGDDINIDYNIGASVYPDDGQTVSSMMKNADLAMYDAKLAGRNNYVIFKYSETGQALKQKVEMEENLKLAIKNNHIKVFFQPKISAVTEDIIGFEALVRWIDPEIGMINPGQFIPLAEETSLINPIGEFVAKRSAEMIERWQKMYGLELTCSINLSVVQLMDVNLPEKLEKIVNASGVHPHYIDFEITETMNLDEVPNLVESLNKIVSIGCTLSIDDFGTGHSSLDYVKRIPATYIKIDQSFVKNIGLNPEDEAILDATISIAKRLDRKLIAEGVETEEQREYLLERGCEYFQGFLFSRPLPEEKIEQLLSERVKLMGTN